MKNTRITIKALAKLLIFFLSKIRKLSWIIEDLYIAVDKHEGYGCFNKKCAWNSSTSQLVQGVGSCDSSIMQ